MQHSVFDCQININFKFFLISDDKTSNDKSNVKKDVGKSPKKGKDSSNETDEAPKKKRKIRLEMHSHQASQV